MSVSEKTALDMAPLLTTAYELGDMVIASKECRDYLHWKKIVQARKDIQQAIREFGKKKEALEECQRFGLFHPDYHKALKEADKAADALEAIEEIRCYKQAEDRLDQLLHEISEQIARAVSDDIKVPGNELTSGCDGCSSGGSCSGNCG